MIFKDLMIEDIDEVIYLFIEAFNKEPWNDKWTKESAYSRLKQMINCEGYYGMKAYEEERLVGFILGNHEYYYDGMHFNIKEFCIDATIQGKGIGSKVLNEFSLRLKNKGINHITLYTLKSDLTQKFYEKNDFKITNDAIIMEKDI